MRIAVIGHTGTVGQAVFEYYRDHPNELTVDVVGWSLDAQEWDFRGADFVFVCVPTPAENPDGIVREAIARIEDDPIILIKSTVPPGTTDRLQWEFRNKRIAFSPEFLTARTAAKDWRNPERQIVGYTGRTFSVASQVFGILPKSGREYLVTAVEAEILKYVHNLHGAMQVILANHWHDVCKATGAEFERIKEIAPTRVLGGETIRTYWDVFRDGKRGYMGACFPKDVETMIGWARDWGVRGELFEATQAANLRILRAQGLEDGINRSDRDVSAESPCSVRECGGAGCSVCGCKS